MGEKLTHEEQRLLEQADRVDAWSRTFFYLMFLLLFCAAAVLAWQSITWLKTADWPSPALATLGAEPLKSAWQGINEIYEYIIDAPLSLVLLFCAIFSGWIGTLGEVLETDELRTARMKRAKSQSSL